MAEELKTKIISTVFSQEKIVSALIFGFKPLFFKYEADLYCCASEPVRLLYLYFVYFVYYIIPTKPKYYVIMSRAGF